MTTTGNVDRSTRKSAARRLAPTIVTAVLVFLLASWLLFTSLYNPLGMGSFWGAGRNVEVVDLGDDRPQFFTQGREGDTAVVMYSLRNNGSLPVRLAGLDETSSDAGSTLQWSPIWGGGPAGDPRRPRDLPATIAAGQEITLWLTLVKPDCSRYPPPSGGGGGRSGLTTTVIGLRWSVLGRERGHDLRLAPESLVDASFDQETFDQPILRCDSTLDKVRPGT